MYDSITADERRREREADARRVLITDNPYGYKLNIANKTLNKWYESYKLKNGIHGAPSEVQRIDWEKKAIRFIKKRFKEVYHDTLCEPIIGWRKQQLEELVQMMGAEEI